MEYPRFFRLCWDNLLTLIGLNLLFLICCVPLVTLPAALTALAGPVSNFVLALLALLCARLVYHQYGVLWDFIFDLLLTTAYLSIGLGLFNLIPISPLDGSKVLFAFLPDSAYEKLMRYEKYGMIALLILVWLGVGDNVLSTAIYNVYAAMINFVFRGIV